MRQLDDEHKSRQFWAELNGRFRLPLLAYFLRRVLDRAEAEDLTQEVFTRLARRSDAPHTDLQAYLFVTAANLLKDRARLRASRQASSHRSIEDIHEKLAATLAEDLDPERVLIGKDTLREFVQVLGELGERTRDIFVLTRIEHMSQRDVARLFGISVSAVEKHVMKALNHLGARLAPP